MDLNWSADGGTGGDDIDRILQRLEALNDRASLSHLDHEARTLEFWESLEPEQLHYIRTMLKAIVTSDGAVTQASYHLGVAETLLRIKFRKCPKCMQSHDTDDCFQKEVTQQKNEYRAACEQYNVIPEDASGRDFMVGGVRCRSCPATFDSLSARMHASSDADCPGCKSATTSKNL